MTLKIERVNPITGKERTREQIEDIKSSSIAGAINWFDRDHENPNIPENNELFLITEHQSEKKYKENSLKAAIYIDKETRRITFCYRGTRSDALMKGVENANKHKNIKAKFKAFSKGYKELMHDVQSDIYLALNLIPPQFKPIQELNNLAIETFKAEFGNTWKEEIAKYEMNFTGHSLGGSNSQLALADMVVKFKKENVNIDNLSCNVFDPPGVGTQVKKIFKENNVDFKHYPKDKVKIQLARPNFINKAGDEQLGKLSETLRRSKSNDNGVGMWIRYLREIISTKFFKRLCEHIIYGGFVEHNLGPMQEALKGHENNIVIKLEKREGNISQEKYEPHLFKVLQQIKDTETKASSLLDKVKKPTNRFFMVGPNDEKIKYSKRDRFAAADQLNPKLRMQAELLSKVKKKPPSYKGRV